ncbi:MAG: sigma-70 family RNA polymerase sigma factor [Ruthenibacterium sp.]
MQPYHTEQELAAALARREEAAAEQLVREYGGLLNAVVRRHAPGLDADDILADALLAIWQNAGRFDGRRSFKAWAAAVARYRAIDAVRRAARTCLAGGTQELERIAGHTPDEYFALELEDMFRGLTDEDRALLLGRYFYGSTPVQQAAARGISVGAVNTRVARARQRLARRLRERSEGE